MRAGKRYSGGISFKVPGIASGYLAHVLGKKFHFEINNCFQKIYVRESNIFYWGLGHSIKIIVMSGISLWHEFQYFSAQRFLGSIQLYTVQYLQF